ncbi:MAG: TonB-dependent receptor [Saprospiraceae bacterium]|nr:TonB-dependent receptor [Saprospiraceae bacterium]
MKKTLTILIALFLVQTGYSQLVEEIDSVTVTASRVPTSIIESGRSVTVLTSSDLENAPVASLDELIRFTTGVNVNARQGFGVQTDFGMRGSTFSQVLVLVDGVRLNDPLTAHFNNNFPIPLSEIEQVEIIRGPASASYGTDAVGGVIHVKTKTFLHNENQQGFESTGRLFFGDNDLFDTDLGVTGHFNNVSVSAAVKVASSDGETLDNPNFTLNPVAQETFDNYFDVVTTTAAVNYRPNEEWTVNGRLGWDSRDFAAKYFYTRSTFDESIEDTRSFWSQFSMARSKNNNTTELSVGYKTTDDIFAFNPLFSANEHTTDRLFLNLGNNTKLGEKGELALGAQYDRREIESTDRGDHENYNTEFYGILFYPLNEEVNATIGARGGRDDSFGWKFTPQLNLAFNKDTYSLRTSVGRAVRSGDFTERFISSQILNLSPGRNIGNPDLDTESSWTFEIGGDFFPSNQVLINSSIFYRASENLIDYTFTNADNIENATNLQAGEDYFYATNISNTDTFGAELSINTHFELTTTSKLLLNGGYTFLDTSNDADAVSKYLANHPDHNINFVVGIDTKWFALSSATNFIQRDQEIVDAIGAEVQDSYAISHLNASIKPGIQGVRFNGRVNNIFDENYQEILGAQLPGRWFSAGFGWNVQ